MFTLRPYQKEAVQATIKHFQHSLDPAVVVLPTGAGKSLVIAQLAALAKGRVLVLAHVKELVEQNHAKYCQYGVQGGVYSAGLKQKQTEQQVIFASVQSLACNLDSFQDAYSLLVIDECHRVSGDEESQYGRIIAHLKSQNPQLKVLGLTATPYRMGIGWIYQYHHYGITRSIEPRPFSRCIYELPLSYMIKAGYLTKPQMIDAAIAQYDFSQLSSNAFGEFNAGEVNELLARHPRVTEGIVEQLVSLAAERQGVMIFAATVEHAHEISAYLPSGEAALISGDTPLRERDDLIAAFKRRDIKYLVNVAVLTTGFDAPHVDLIAILRPTQSQSLFQQIVGRGLRLAPGKEDCLVIDYAGNGFNLYYPEVGSKKPSSDSVPVQVFCPECGFANTFWGKLAENGDLIEHYGRRCWGLLDDSSGQEQVCEYRFRFKECPSCHASNDIAARRCHSCRFPIIDPDDQLKAALQLKDALVIRCSGMYMSQDGDILSISYCDEEGVELKERFDFANKKSRAVFNQQFGTRFQQGAEPKVFTSIEEVIKAEYGFVAPDFVIARKVSRSRSGGSSKTTGYWRVQEKIFDYKGRYRKANQLA